MLSGCAEEKRKMRRLIRYLLAFVLALNFSPIQFRSANLVHAQAPAPTLKGIAPETIAAGGPSFTLRLEGQNFVDGAKVLLDGIALGSPRVDTKGKVLLAEVDAAIIASPGTHAVQAINPDGQATATLTLKVVAKDPELDIRLGGTSVEEDFQSDVTIDISGSGFDSTSTALVWGLEPEKNEFFPPDTLKVQIAQRLLKDPARIPIMVRNKGDRFSNAEIFFVVPRPATVDNVDPNSIEVGTDPFNIKVFGSNFKPDAKIVVAGQKLDTTQVKGHLEATVPAALRSEPRQLAVRVEQDGIQSQDFIISVTPSDKPFIYSLAPVRIRQGEKKPTIDIIGANFAEREKGITAMIDGKEVDIKATTRRRLTIAMPPELLESIGTHTVQLKDKEGNLSNTANFDVVSDVTVSTFVGINRDGFNLGCASAQEAMLRFPSRVTIGPDGLMYITDRLNHAIRTINLATGQVCTIVGEGIPGYNDSGNPRGFGPTFSNPQGIVVTSDGTIYVPENGNSVIRRIRRGSRGSDVAVDTFAGASNLITDKSRQDRLHSTKVGIEGYRDGPALEAFFRQPDDIVAATDGSFYVSDSNNHAIRRIFQSSSGTFVETVAGNGVPGFADGDGKNARFRKPTGLALSPDGRSLFVADTDNNRVRRIDLATGKVETVAGSGDIASQDGPGSDASFDQPIGLVADSNGTLYVTEFGGNRVRRIDVAGNVTTVAGGTTGKQKFREGPGLSATFRSPRGITMDRTHGILYIVDTENQRVRKIELR
jgi:DNA-binding beta-propeller fold protein YncE